MSKSWVSSIVWLLSSSIGSIVIKLAILIVLSRILGPDDFGLYAVVMAVSLISTTVGQFGIPTFVATTDEDNLDLLGLALFLGVVSGVLVISVAAVILLIYDNNLLINNHRLFFCVLILVALQIYINIIEAFLRRKLLFKRMAISELVAAIIGTGLISFFSAKAGLGGEGLILGQIFYCGIKITISVWGLNLVGIKKLSQESIRKIFNNSINVTIAESANMATVHVQRPIIGFNLGLESVGIWSRVYQVILIQLGVLVQPLDAISIPIIRRANNNELKIKSMVVCGVQVIGLLSLPCAAITIILAKLFIPVAFGEEWIGLILPLQIGAVLIFFRGVERIFLSLSKALNIMKERAVVQVMQLFVTILCIVVFSPFGIITLSWAYVGASFICFCFSVYSISKAAKIIGKDMMFAIFPGVLFFVLFVIFDWFNKSIFTYELVGLSEFISVVVGVGVNLAILRFYGGRLVHQDIRNLFNSKMSQYI